MKIQFNNFELGLVDEPSAFDRPMTSIARMYGAVQHRKGGIYREGPWHRLFAKTTTYTIPLTSAALARGMGRHTDSAGTEHIYYILNDTTTPTAKVLLIGMGTYKDTLAEGASYDATFGWGGATCENWLFLAGQGALYAANAVSDKLKTACPAAATGTITATEGTTGNLLAGTYGYYIAFKDPDTGAIGNPNTLTSKAINNLKKCELSVIPTSSGYHRVIFRSKGVAGTAVVYQHATIADDTTTTYTDNTEAAGSTTVMSTDHTPITGLQLLCSAGAMLFGVKVATPSVLEWSKQAEPWYWPQTGSYQMDMAGKVRAITVAGDYIVVFTDHTIELVNYTLPTFSRQLVHTAVGTFKPDAVLTLGNDVYFWDNTSNELYRLRIGGGLEPLLRARAGKTLDTLNAGGGTSAYPCLTYEPAMKRILVSFDCKYLSGGGTLAYSLDTGAVSQHAFKFSKAVHGGGAGGDTGAKLYVCDNRGAYWEVKAPLTVPTMPDGGAYGRSGYICFKSDSATNNGTGVTGSLSYIDGGNYIVRTADSSGNLYATGADSTAGLAMQGAMLIMTSGTNKYVEYPIISTTYTAGPPAYWQFVLDTFPSMTGLTVADTFVIGCIPFAVRLHEITMGRPHERKRFNAITVYTNKPAATTTLDVRYVVNLDDQPLTMDGVTPTFSTVQATISTSGRTVIPLGATGTSLLLEFCNYQANKALAIVGVEVDADVLAR